MSPWMRSWRCCRQTLWGHPDGIVFETVQEGGKPSVDHPQRSSGGTAARAACVMAIAAMARQGNNLIVDDVLLDGDNAAYEAALAGLDVVRVGVFAPLEILEAREAARGDRMIGWHDGNMTAFTRT